MWGKHDPDKPELDFYTKRSCHKIQELHNQKTKYGRINDTQLMDFSHRDAGPGPES
jgi:hypothetical protein